MSLGHRWPVSGIGRQTKSPVPWYRRCPAGLLHPGDDLLQGCDFALQCLDSLAGNGDPSLGTASLVSLFDAHQASGLQYLKVLREVSRGEFKSLLKEPELDSLGFVGDREYSEPGPLVDDLVKGLARFGHGFPPIL